MRAIAAIVVLIAVAAPAAAVEEIGFADPTTGEWYLPGQEAFYFGNPGDNPFMGDWDCDGVPTPGLHRSIDGFVYLRDTNTQGIADRRFYFGNPGDVPIAGDWDGDGCDTVSLWRPSQRRVYIIDRLGSEDRGLGVADYFYEAGSPGERPVAADLDGDGKDTVGFHDPATGLITIDGDTFYFGNPGDRITALGGDGGDALTAYRPDQRLVYAAGGSCRDGSRRWIPVAGPPAESDGGITVAVGGTERQALAPGVGIEVRWGSRSAILDDCAPTARLDAPLGTELSISYRSPRGRRVAPEWTQTVTASTVTLHQPWRREGSTDGSIVLAWQSTGDSSRYLGELDRAPGLTVTSPIRWRINADGTINGTPDASFAAAAHGRGIEVWPAIASLDADRIAAALVDPEGVAARVAADAQAAGVDGVNIDLEGYRFEDVDLVVRFAAELTRLVHQWGGVTSLDITPRTDTWDITSIEFDALHWSQAPPRRELAEAVDYLILMAYDEHNRHRPAGPVASPHWVEDVTRYLLRFADHHEVVLGVPFYGRLWGPDFYDRPRARGIGSLTASESSGVRSYDVRFGLDRVDFADGTYLWSETPAGLAHRVALKDELGLAGLAAWRLGFDSSAIWPTVAP